MSNASNESPARPANELPLSPSTYYDSIPLTTQLPLNVAREILRDATICQKEEPLPVSPWTGVNVLHNSDCTTADAVEVAEGLTAMIKNRESFHQLRILLLQEQITRLRERADNHPDNDHPDEERPRFQAPPIGFTINAGHLPDATIPCRRNTGHLAKCVRCLPNSRALLHTKDTGPRDQ